MGLDKKFKEQRIFIDTNIVIYAAEVKYKDVTPSLKDVIATVRALFMALSKEELILVTSELTLSEVLTGAILQKKPRLADYYRRSLSSSGVIETIPVDRVIWEKVSYLRARFGSGLKTPDAIQIAAAIENQCDYLFCNDKQVAKLATQTQEITGIYLSDL